MPVCSLNPVLFATQIEDDVRDRRLSVRAVRTEQLYLSIVLERHQRSMGAVLPAREWMQVADRLPPVHRGDDLGVAHILLSSSGLAGFCQRAAGVVNVNQALGICVCGVRARISVHVQSRTSSNVSGPTLNARAKPST